MEPPWLGAHEELGTVELLEEPAREARRPFGLSGRPLALRLSLIFLVCCCCALLSLHQSPPVHFHEEPAEATPALLADDYRVAEEAASEQLAVRCYAGGASGPHPAQALRFPGASLPSPSFSLVVTLRTARRNESQVLLAWALQGPVVGGVELRLDSGGNLQYCERASREWNCVAAVPTLGLADGSSYDVAVVRKEWGLVSLFVDGKLVAISTVPPKLPEVLEPWASTMRSQTRGLVFRGHVTDLRLFSSPLRDEEVADARGMAMCPSTTVGPNVFYLQAERLAIAAGASAARADMLGSMSFGQDEDATGQRTSTSRSTARSTAAAATSTWTSSTTSTRAETTTVTTTTRTSSALATAGVRVSSVPYPSIYCFSLMMPIGYEPGLIMAQLGKSIGIFACDGHSVFSNCTRRLDFMREGGQAVWTVDVNGSLDAPLGGQFHTALNTGVFIRVWRAVMREGKYRAFDWTVKADPDSVFLPHRLRSLLLSGHHTAGTIYLNNCKFGLHGPLEVFSRAAVDLFVPGLHRCEKWRDEPWGEDWFMDRCMQFLGAERVDEFRLLSETHCNQHPYPCEAASVAFHPFKDIATYLQCNANAESTGTWP